MYVGKKVLTKFSNTFESSISAKNWLMLVTLGLPLLCKEKKSLYWYTTQTRTAVFSHGGQELYLWAIRSTWRLNDYNKARTSRHFKLRKLEIFSVKISLKFSSKGGYWNACDISLNQINNLGRDIDDFQYMHASS